MAATTRRTIGFSCAPCFAVNACASIFSRTANSIERGNMFRRLCGGLIILRLSHGRRFFCPAFVDSERRRMKWSFRIGVL